MTQSYTTTGSPRGKDLFKNMAKKKTDKGSKKPTQPKVQLGEHGRYQIKSGLLAGTFVARAFPSGPTAARGLIAEASGATEEAAIAALHAAIDAREKDRIAARRTDEQTGTAVPSLEEYIEAIGQVSFTAPQKAMLLELSLAGPEGLAEGRMANAGGYKSRTSAKRSFAGAGQSIAAYLDAGSGTEAAQEHDGLSLLGIRGGSPDDEEPGNWILHPELREAIRAVL